VVRIGTWNLENLFRPGDPDGPKDQATYDAKLTALADTITRIGPDVLAVQEVGNPDALADLVERLGDGWEQPRTATVADGTPHPIRVGFLSRLPLEAVTEYSAFPTGLRPVQVSDSGPGIAQMGRAALRARVTTPGGTRIDILTAHLKSKLLEFPPGPNGQTRFDTRDEGERARYAYYALARRAAEAATVRAAATALLDGRGQDRPLVVLGDMNDEPAAATTQILQGPPGSEIGTGGFTPPDRGDAQRLWNLAAYIPEAQRFSRVYRGRGELIDHIFVSHALLASIGEGAVHTDWTTQPTPSITDQPRTDDAGSDHRPVVADFTLT
jgi:endonuclease/exonuclease/phosphatase family metal-dependent hydrolase